MFLPIAIAARMGTENLYGLSDGDARTLSMWSIAGIMEGRLGVPREKKRVASLKT